MSTQHDPIARLVMMANQIAKNLAPQGDAKATDAAANHIQKFWDPRMRAAIFAHVEKGGAGLEPIALGAVKKVMAAKAVAGH